MLTAQFISVGFRSAKPGNVQTFIGTPGKRLASLAFDNKREDNLREKLAEERKEKAEYAKKVGQLTMQVDWLKKKSEEIVGPDYESKFSPKPFDD